MSPFLYFLIPIAAGICFLFSLTSFLQRPAPLYLRLFSIYLIVDCTVELLAGYQALHFINNLLLSSLSSVVSFCFYLYVIRGFIHRPKAKRVLLYLILILPAVLAINIFLQQKFSVFQSMAYSLGCLFVVGACIYYFWELFQHTYYVKLTSQPAFWICSGLLIYYVVTFPTYAFINFVTRDLQMIKVLAIILDSVNILLYLSFTIAFLCRLKIRNTM